MINNLIKILVIACVVINLTVTIALADNFNDGLNSFNNQDYNKAIEFFQKTEQENPDDIETHKWLAKCYSELFMVDLSLKEMDKVKKLEDKKNFPPKTKIIETKPTVNEEENKPATINITINGTDESKSDKYIGKKKLRIAILDFKYKNQFNYDYNDRNKIPQSITENLTSDILNSGMNIVERAQIDEVIKELKFENSEYVLKESAKKIGKLYGIDYLLLGYILDFKHDNKTLYNPKQKSIIKKEASIRVSARLINIETGEIVFSDVLSDIYQDLNYEFDSMSDFELEDIIMSRICKKISKKAIDKLNDKFYKAKN